MATWCLNSEKIICKYDFPYLFKKISFCYKKIGYNIDVLRQTAYLVFIQSTTLLASLFARRYVGPQTERWQHSRPNLIVTWAVGDGHPFRVVLGQAYRGLSGWFLLLRIFSAGISVSPHVCFILDLILISMFLR